MEEKKSHKIINKEIELKEVELEELKRQYANALMAQLPKFNYEELREFLRRNKRIVKNRGIPFYRNLDPNNVFTYRYPDHWCYLNEDGHQMYIDGYLENVDFKDSVFYLIVENQN